MATTLEHPDGQVLIEELPDQRRRLTVIPKDKDLFMLKSRLETFYPVDLIQLLLDEIGPAPICDEIMRDEDPMYVERLLRNDLFAYFDKDDFEGKTILDFGCGSGASTMILARMFPNSQITGVEMLASKLKIAEKRREFYDLDDVDFVRSPTGTQIPANLGQYDFVILSAVYEHLLPDERKIILEQLWAVVRAAGFLFVNQTQTVCFRSNSTQQCCH